MRAYNPSRFAGEVPFQERFLLLLLFLPMKHTNRASLRSALGAIAARKKHRHLVSSLKMGKTLLNANQRRLRIPRGDLLDQFSLYLLEPYNGDQTKAAEVFRNLDNWNSLVCGYSDSQIEIEIRRLCDWIEADAALTAFGNYRLHRPTMAGRSSKSVWRHHRLDSSGPF